jgi:hypothetical protein
LAPEGTFQRLGKKRSAILLALSLPDGDLLVREIDVLPPETESFGEMEPCPREQMSNEAIGSLHLAEQGVQVQAVLLICRKRPVIIETRRGRSA